MEQAGNRYTELIIRPTGLVDPKIEVRPVLGQVDDMLHEIRIRAEKQERVLITTLTKRMSEDLTEYYLDLDVRVRYMHSDIDAVERTQILHDLRAGEFDVLVGINLLGKASTFLRFRWWGSSTQTRKVFSVPPGP